MLNFRKRWSRRIKLLRADACSASNILSCSGIMLFFGYLLFQIFILRKTEVNKPEIGAIMTVSCLLQSFGSILIAKRKKTVSGTGIEVLRGKKAVRVGLRTAFLMALMASFIFYGLVVLKL